MLHAPARQTEPVYVTDQTLMRSYLALCLLFPLSIAYTICCFDQNFLCQPTRCASPEQFFVARKCICKNLPDTQVFSRFFQIDKTRLIFCQLRRYWFTAMKLVFILAMEYGWLISRLLNCRVYWYFSTLRIKNLLDVSYD